MPYGGYFTPSDATGDIHKFTRGLAEACARRGVVFRYDTAVTDAKAGDRSVSLTCRSGSNAVDTNIVTSDAVVLCAGTASRRLGARLGDRLNVYPVKGYSITVHLEHPAARDAAPEVSLLDDAAKIVTSRLGDDRFRVAGTAEFSGFNRDIRVDRIAPLIAWTRLWFPAVPTDQVVAWAGLRPMMPDMMPRVGPGKRPGVFYNTGHGHLGWTLSAATAEIVADSVARQLDVRWTAGFRSEPVPPPSHEPARLPGSAATHVN